MCAIVSVLLLVLFFFRLCVCVFCGYVKEKRNCPFGLNCLLSNLVFVFLLNSNWVNRNGYESCTERWCACEYEKKALKMHRKQLESVPTMQTNKKNEN